MADASFEGDVRHGGAGGGALGVHGASRKIGKAAEQAQQQRKPVIIYMVSPKVIHVEAHEFRSLVQRLTGPDTSGKKEIRASTSSSPGPSTGPRKGAGRAAPVRVKARALNRPGPAVSVSVSATRQHVAPSAAGPGPSPSPSGFLFQDLSPLRGAAVKGEAPLVSPGWLYHVGDHFLSPGATALGSPSAFLDIFGPLSSQHH